MMEICIWADGFWCKKKNIEEYYQFMSDDYFTVNVSDTMSYEDIDELAMQLIQTRLNQSWVFKR